MGATVAVVNHLSRARCRKSTNGLIRFVTQLHCHFDVLLAKIVSNECDSDSTSRAGAIHAR